MALNQAMAFTFVLVRVGCVVVFLPFLGEGQMPVSAKVALVVALAVVLFPVSPVQVSVGARDPVEFVLCVFAEGLFGCLIGFVAGTIFLSIRMAGELVSQEMGMALSMVVDPLTGVEDTTLANLCEMVGIITFFALGGHHMMLRALHESFVRWPIGSFLSAEFLKEVSLTSASRCLLIGLQLAAPLVLLTFMLSLLMAVMARLVPEVNVLIVGFPLRVGTGLLGLAFFMPLLVRGYGDVARAVVEFTWGASGGG